jgi:hypothetical protein
MATFRSRFRFGVAMATFRLDVSDPVVCNPKEMKPLCFSFEDAGLDGECTYATFALSVGLAPWIGQWDISEAGLRVLARAASAMADQVQATNARRKEKK